MYLTLVRHAESVWNATGQWQGQTDVPLSPRGRLQARAFAQRMFGVEHDHRYCSDLSRAAETAGALGAPAAPDPRFREIDVGAWAGMRRSAVKEKFPEEVRALRSGEAVRIGGGESMPEFAARVDGAIDELRAAHGGERVLLVTHGGVIRALATRILDARTRMSPLVGVGNTSFSIVRDVEGELVLERYNDGRHLDPADHDSAMVRAPESSTRVAVVAVDPGGSADRRLVDAILAGLGIARFVGPSSILDTPLARELLVEPLPEDGIDGLREEHVGSAFGLVVDREDVPLHVAPLLDLTARGGDSLGVPAHGTVSQVRLFDQRAELYSYGLPFDD